MLILYFFSSYCIKISVNIFINKFTRLIHVSKYVPYYLVYINLNKCVIKGREGISGNHENLTEKNITY